MKLNAFRTLGRSGLRVSPVTLGTMTFGDGSWGADDETSVAILDRYLQSGGNFIDTANVWTTVARRRPLGASRGGMHPRSRPRSAGPGSSWWSPRLWWWRVSQILVDLQCISRRAGEADSANVTSDSPAACI